MSKYLLTDEGWLAKNYWTQIDKFWQEKANTIEFKGVNGAKICGVYLINPQSDLSITISSGRVESYLKYKEVIFNLYQNGYSVFILDHRGQGLSQRLTDNLQIGYVESFNYYVDDLKTFYDKVVSPHAFAQHYLLCHSMGGCIGLNYLIRYQHDFDKCVMCAPMVGFITLLPKCLATRIVDMAIFLNKKLDRSPSYFWGLGDYADVPFSENRLTHSDVRYQIFREEYNQHPSIQLGGASFEWIKQADIACEQMVELIHKIDTPCLFLQAEKEQVVSNQAQKTLVQYNDKLALQVIKGALHEILIEKDGIRNIAMTQILDYFT